jgi:uncharacterized protein (TIGR02231 family)
MRNFYLLFALLIFTKYAFSNEIEIQSKAKEVVIYHSGALVKRTANFTLEPGFNEISIPNVSSKLVLSSLKFTNRDLVILNKRFLKKLTNEEKNSLLDEKDALVKQLQLIELKYQNPSFISNVDELDKMNQFYNKNVTKIKKDLRMIEEKLNLDSKLTLTLDNKNVGVLKLLISVNKRVSESITFEYICGGIGWAPNYELSVTNVASNLCTLNYFSKVMSQTGEEWKDIKVSFSSFNPLFNNSVLPKASEPWTIDSPREVFSSKSNNDEEMIEDSSTVDKLEGVEYKNINVPLLLKDIKLDGVYSISSNGTLFSFPLKTVSIPAHFYYYSYPVFGNDVFLVAEIKNIDTLGFIDGKATILFKDREVGKTMIQFSKSSSELIIPITADNSVIVTKNELASQTFNKGDRKVTLAYRFDIKNHNTFPIQVKVIDQLPISQISEVNISLEETSNGTVNSEDGEITWDLQLQGAEKVSKELKYIIKGDYPIKTRFGTQKAVQYRSLSCPSF